MRRHARQEPRRRSAPEPGRQQRDVEHKPRRYGDDGELYCDVYAGRKDSAPKFTDGHSTSPFACSKPGWRIPTHPIDRTATRDALREYEADLVSAWRGGPQQTTQTPTAPPLRRRADAAAIAARDQAYLDYDKEISEAYRSGKSA